MVRDLRVGMAIEAEDRGATRRVRAVSRAIERETKRTADTTVRHAEQGARAQERAASRGSTAAQRMYQDRERLGIRSEQRIQREIALTEAAYNRLARTGRLSANELARASQSAQQRMQALRQEMQAVRTAQRIHGPIGRGLGIANRGLQVYQGAAGAALATGYAMAQPVTRSMDFDRRMAAMANTAFADRDLVGRQAGAADLAAAVKEAVRTGGGNRDAAADALDAMLASGEVSWESSLRLLPMLQRASTATGASSVDMTNIAIRAKGFGIADEDIGRAIDMATKAGQEGGFEIRDMARWLPQIMAAAGAAGMRGIDDFGAILAGLQAARRTAGTSDEAGNNFLNWVAKLTSRDTAEAASQIEIAPGKSIDLTGTIADARGKGLNALDAFVAIVDRIVASNGEYQKIQARLRDAEAPDEQRAILESQADLLQGSSVGTLVRDRQALMGLLGYLNNREYVQRVRGALGDSEGTLESNFAVIAATNSYRAEQAKNSALFAESEGMAGVNNVIGSASELFSDMAEKYPQFTAGLVTATEALNALALAAGAVAAIGFVRSRGGKAAVNRATGAVTAAERAAAGAGAAAASRGAALAGRAGSAALGVAGSVAAIDAAQTLMSDAPANEKARELTGTAFGAAGALGGAKAGAAAGAFTGPAAPVAVPLLASIGGALGYFLGDKLGDALGKGFFSKEPEPPAPLGPDDDVGAAFVGPRTRFQPKQEVEVRVTVENGDITASVVDRLARENRRH